MITIGEAMNCGTCEHWERHDDWYELDDFGCVEWSPVDVDGAR